MAHNVAAATEVVVASAVRPPPVRDPVAVNRRLNERGRDTYIDEIFAARDSNVRPLA